REHVARIKHDRNIRRLELQCPAQFDSVTVAKSHAKDISVVAFAFGRSDRVSHGFHGDHLDIRQTKGARKKRSSLLVSCAKNSEFSMGVHEFGRAQSYTACFTLICTLSHIAENNAHFKKTRSQGSRCS